MLRQKVRIGSAVGYWGDLIDQGLELVDKDDVQYLGFDFLSEPTLIGQQEEKKKDPTKGFVAPLTGVTRMYLPLCHRKGVRIITDAGGANPEAGADAVVDTAKKLGLSGIKVAAIYGGEDVLDLARSLLNSGCKFESLDTGKPFPKNLIDKVTGAYIYTGSDLILEALKQGAEVVVCGRAADDSLYLGPLRYEFDWADDDWDKLACGTCAGHIMECGKACTGGISNAWKDVPNPARIGYPIAEVYPNGEFFITKPNDTGGLVNRVTVAEHLLYEVHDPANYIQPEVIADFTNAKLQDLGNNQVKVTGIKGKKRPDNLKMIISYPAGYRAEALAGIPGPEALAKARWTEKVVRDRFKIIGLNADDVLFSYMGYNSLHGPASPEVEPNEIWFRCAARCQNYDDAVKVVREVTALPSGGPIGTAGMFFPARPVPVVALWPTLIPREKVVEKLVIKEVR